MFFYKRRVKIQSTGIVGLGHVGALMHELFPDSRVYDEPKKIGTRKEINACDIAFVCVPTPSANNGECDTSIVEDVLGWIEASVIVIRSTIPVGFTEKWKSVTKKHLVFQPEYYGETVAHPFADPFSRDWITLGGDVADTREIVRLYKNVYNSHIKFHVVDSITAELAKYMENSFLAMKVTFCNQFYDIADAFGVDYDLLRETWLMDPGIGRSHTFVYEDNRGYGGSCLPKDLEAIIVQAEKLGVDIPLIRAIKETNRLYRKPEK